MCSTPSLSHSQSVSFTATKLHVYNNMGVCQSSPPPQSYTSTTTLVSVSFTTTKLHVLHRHKAHVYNNIGVSASPPQSYTPVYNNMGVCQLHRHKLQLGVCQLHHTFTTVSTTTKLHVWCLPQSYTTTCCHHRHKATRLQQHWCLSASPPQSYTSTTTWVSVSFTATKLHVYNNMGVCQLHRHKATRLQQHGCLSASPPQSYTSTTTSVSFTATKLHVYNNMCLSASQPQSYTSTTTLSVSFTTIKLHVYNNMGYLSILPSSPKHLLSTSP